jgi:hypothetical protein
MPALHISPTVSYPRAAREATIDYSDEDSLQLQGTSQHPEMYVMVATNLRDTDDVLHKMELIFNNFLQKELKEFLKAIIKVIEPNKQKRWPYYLGESAEKKAANPSKKRKECGDLALMQPPWWPESVAFKEPDHQRRDENIELCVKIMKWLMMEHEARSYPRFVDDDNNPGVIMSPVQFVLQKKDNALANAFQNPSKNESKTSLFRASLSTLWALAKAYDECVLGNRGMKLCLLALVHLVLTV